MENVIWKPVNGYEGYYEVSNNGDIRSVDRIVGGNGAHSINGVFMKPQVGAGGYLTVCLSKNGKSKPHKIHRIVASAFIDNPDNKPMIDHINTDRTDNRIENLRWVTALENSRNPLSIKHHVSPSKKCEKKSNPIHRNIRKTAHNYPKKVYRYDLNGNYIDGFVSIIDAERSTQIEMSGIRKALDRSYKTAGGFLWKTKKSLFCEPYSRRRHTKCIMIRMIDGNGTTIKSWDAIRDAAIELKTTHSRILRHIEKNAPLNGFLFEYVRR